MATTLSDEELLTRAQIARRLGISSERVHQLWSQGKLACIATPLGRLSTRDDVEAFARERADRPSRDQRRTASA